MKSSSALQSPNVRLREAFKLAWERLGTKRLLLLIACFMIFSESILHVLIPILLEWYFNYLEEGSLLQIKWLLSVFTLIVIATGVIHTIGYYMKQNLLSSLHRDLAVELADEAQRMPLQIAQASHSADIAQRVSRDSDKLPWMLGTILDWMGNQALLLLLASIYMLQLNWRIAIFVIILLPLGVLGSHLMRHRLKHVGIEIANQEAVFQQCQQDALQGMETLRAFGAESWMLNRFSIERAKLNKLYLRRMWWLQGVNSVSSSLALFINWGTILAVAYLAIKGKMTIGSMMAFSILIWRIHGPLVQLGNAWGDIQEKLGASRRIFSLWRAQKEPQRNVTSMEPGIAMDEPAIRLHDVSFRYEENAGLQDDVQSNFSSMGTASAASGSDALWLNRLSLDIEPGSFAAIVGPSGGGKSTIAKLAAGLYFPYAGDVCIGGASTKANAEYARRMVTYVPQTPYLFAGTIRENLMMVHPEATERDLIEAASAAQAHDFIESLPNGYDTSLKEHGSTLSGGQKQRIALARAILMDRAVLVLDEATSALDTDTERRVMDAIRSLTKAQGKTLLVIAHRLTTVQQADKIYVIQGGVIVEQGTHPQLLQTPGSLYSDLWRF